MTCPYCGSEHVIKKGRRSTNFTKQQQFKCKNCSGWFSLNIDKETGEYYRPVAQLYADKNRLLTKQIRDTDRLYNALTKLGHSIETYLKNLKPIKIPKIKTSKKDTKCIVQISDVHFGEIIDENSNKYNMQIAKERLFLYANKVKMYLKAHNVKDVYICFTGDMFNSDRRLDEIMMNAGARGNTLVQAFQIVEQFIIDIAKEYNVTVHAVVGNESRLNKEFTLSTPILSDNYDWILQQMLYIRFRDTNVTIDNDVALEKIIKIGGQNVLMLHGVSFPSNLGQKHVQELLGKYTLEGIPISLVIFGHVHSTYISNVFARSGSLSGSNGYSLHELNYIGRASQNLHFLYPNNTHDTIQVDLQI